MSVCVCVCVCARVHGVERGVHSGVSECNTPVGRQPHPWGRCRQVVVGADRGCGTPAGREHMWLVFASRPKPL